MKLVAATAAAATLLGSATARAGGFDIPDQGTEALGRGGAFVAKADSPLAMYYNVAGLAQQRGTRLLLDINLLWHNMDFTRAGVYPGDPNDPKTPWAGKPYPTVSNQSSFGYQPFLAVTSDFNYFEKWTFGIGVFSPPGASARTYGTKRDIAVTDKDGVEKTASRYEVDLPRKGAQADWNSPEAPVRAPSPTKNDAADSSSSFLMPSLAIAYQPLKYLSLGAAVSWVVGEAVSTKASIYPGGHTQCGASGDLPECDRYSTVHGTFQSYGFIFSALAHPLRWLDLGLTYRPQIDVNAHGTITPSAAYTDGAQVERFPMTLSLKLPHTIRWGVRVKSLYLDGTERADLELGGTWENWAVDDASHLVSDQYPLAQQPCKADPNKPCLTIDTPYGFNNTFSIRLGGAYNHRLSDLSRLIFRAGAYFDSATTKYEYTTVGNYGMAKYGMTLGLGIKVKGFTFDFAYAGVFMPSRMVTNSAIRASASVNGTVWQPTDAAVYPDNGFYQGQIHMVSLGFTVNFNEYGRPVLYPH